jgi:ribulose-5-phosphate 4-epimerase/fuculose-1-phosphate aldolase
MNEIELKTELAYLLHAISYFKWDELIYTHASVRLDQNRYITNDFGLLFEEHTPSNVLEVDMRVGPGDGQNVAGYQIHKAIYQAREDVNCIIHTHTPETIAVASSFLGLWPASQAASLLLPYTVQIPYAGVVDNEETSAQLIEKLDDNYVALLKNHGTLTVGNRVAVAFHRMYRLQKACEAQVMMGEVNNNYMISDIVMDMQYENSVAHNHERPGTDLMWEAVKRKVGITW